MRSELLRARFAIELGAIALRDAIEYGVHEDGDIAIARLRGRRGTSLRTKNSSECKL
jgi:hypothetical protein